MAKDQLKLLLVWFVGSWFTQGNVTAAENCFKLVHGSRNSVCRELARNLNHYCSEPPMRCEIKIDPGFAKDFSYPKWEDIDPLTNINVVAELVRSHAIVASNCKGDCETNWREGYWQKLRQEIIDGIQDKRVRFSRAYIDLNNDGKMELVYRLVGRECPPPGERWFGYLNGNPVLMVLDEATNQFDRDFAVELNLVRYDVLLHLGRAVLVSYDSYDDSWSAYEPTFNPGREQFVVLPYPVCKYQILE